MQDPTPESEKKRQRRKEARPAEIIAAAMRLWAERGFAATRLEDVAAGAGIAKGTIYRYFPSKEALFEAALQDRIAATMDRAREMAQGFDGPTEQMLTGFFETIRAELVDGGSSVFLRVLLSEGHRFPALVARYEKVALTRGLSTVRAILAAGVARGDLRPEAVDCDPRLIMAPAMMLAIWGTVLSTEGLLDISAALRQHVAILIGGLGRRTKGRD
ncbi:MAG: TetR/AcrR family transcriptional regulator [Tabrizicola sp.]|nr:TetR/AcrR family transcriptional regulator [Tabrizicola sp.]